MIALELVCVAAALLVYALVKRHYWFLGQTKKQKQILNSRNYTTHLQIYEDVSKNILTPKQAVEILEKTKDLK